MVKDYCGERNPFYGKHHSKESKLKISESKLGISTNAGILKSKEHKDKLRKLKIEYYKTHPSPRKGIVLSEETKHKISMSKSGKKNPKLSLAKKGKSTWNKGIPQSESSKFKNRLSHLGKVLSNEHKEKCRKATLKLWENDEYKEKVIRNSLKALKQRPTSLEKQMIDIIERNKLPFRYTGDGSTLIGYKIPDFCNSNEEKICIEVRNNRVSKYLQHITPEEYTKRQIEHYAKYGWKCIVFNTDDKLDEQHVLNTLNDNNKVVKGVL